MDFAKICRLCCKEKEQMRSILEDDSNCSLKDIFSSILQIEVFPDDEMPQKICEQCSTTIVEVNQTIENFRENDLLLRQQLFSEIPLKEEVKEMKIELLENPEVEMQLDSDSSSNHEQESLTEQFIEVELEDCDAPENMADDDDDYIPSPVEEQDEEETKVPVKRKRAPPRKAGVPKRPYRKGSFGRPRIRAKPENVPRVNDFICYICKSEPHESNEALFSHLHVVHKDDVPYTCQSCEVETVVIDCVTTLNLHKKMHEMPIKCPHCDRRFNCKNAMSEHIKRTHEDTELGPFKCHQCDKEYPTKAALDMHVYLHSIRIPCDICGKMYSSKTKLGIHIQRKHTQDAKKVECPICKKLLQSLDSVRAHISIMHSKAEPMQCPHCPKSFVWKNSFQHHVKKHEANPNMKYIRDWTNYYTFADPEEAGMKGADRLKKCNMCGVVVRNIPTHMRKKHFPEEYPCTQCDEIFKDKKALEVHLLEHSEGKFLICPICDREFRNRKNLLCHLQTKKHRDHPLAQSLEWLEAKYPAGRTKDPNRKQPSHKRKTPEDL